MKIYRLLQEKAQTHLLLKWRKRKYQKKIKTSVKKSRMELKSVSNKEVLTSEVKEGATYESAIDLADNVESAHLQDIPDNAPLPVSYSL